MTTMVSNFKASTPTVWIQALTSDPWLQHRRVVEVAERVEHACLQALSPLWGLHLPAAANVDDSGINATAMSVQE